MSEIGIALAQQILGTPAEAAAEGLSEDAFLKKINLEYHNALSECHDEFALGSSGYVMCAEVAEMDRQIAFKQRELLKEPTQTIPKTDTGKFDEDGVEDVTPPQQGTKRPANPQWTKGNPYTKIAKAADIFEDAVEKAAGKLDWNTLADKLSAAESCGMTTKASATSGCEAMPKPTNVCKPEYTCEQKHYYFKCLAKAKVDCTSDNFICVDGKPTYSCEEKAKFGECMKNARATCKST